MSIQLHILPATQQIIYKRLSEASWISQYYLAGGTALALQIGHRQSYDFDFFSSADFKNEELVPGLEILGDVKLLSEEKNTLHCTINEINVSFLGYRYQLIDPLIIDGNIRIASMKDITGMKLSAIINRGSKKDFIDLYFLLKYYSLEQIMKFYELKFGNSDYLYVILRALAYFKEADEDPMPVMIKDLDWEEVKNTIRLELKRFNID